MGLVLIQVPAGALVICVLVRRIHVSKRESLWEAYLAKGMRNAHVPDGAEHGHDDKGRRGGGDEAAAGRDLAAWARVHGLR